MNWRQVLGWQQLDYPLTIYVYNSRDSLVEAKLDIDAAEKGKGLQYIDQETGEIYFSRKGFTKYRQLLNNRHFFEEQFEIMEGSKRVGYLPDLQFIQKYLQQNPGAKERLLKSEFLTDMARNLGVL